MASRLDDAVALHWAYNPRCTATVDKHFDGYCTLQHIDAGEVELFYGRHRHLITPGWLWPCFPGPHIRFHRALGCAAWTHRYVAVRGALVDGWRRDGIFPHAPVLPHARMRGEVSERFDRILALLAERTHWGLRRAMNALEGLLLLVSAPAASPAHGWLATAQEMLTEVEPGQLRLAHAAQALGMPVSTFRRRFVAASGLSPRAWAMSERFGRACALLNEDGATVARVARRLGYEDPFLFSRQFRAHAGMSPRRYRDAVALGSRASGPQKSRV